MTALTRRRRSHGKPLILKPYHSGLTQFSTAAFVDGINHRSARIDWATVEPNDTRIPGNSYDWSAVNTFLGTLTPGSEYGKIAIQAGINAPAWLITATGPVFVNNPSRGISGNCPLWWLPVAQDAWARLMTEMARIYDGDPRLTQIVAAEATTVFSEPFMINGGDDTTGLNVYNAGLEFPGSGYTQADAITTMLANTLAAWKHTRVELATHTNWEVPYSGGVHNLVWSVERDFLNPLVVQYGERLTITDYGLGETDPMPPGGETLAAATTQYGWMKARAELPRGTSGAGPCAYQMTLAGALNDANVDTACRSARFLSGNYFETFGWNALTQPHRLEHDPALKTIAASR